MIGLMWLLFLLLSIFNKVWPAVLSWDLHTEYEIKMQIWDKRLDFY